MPENICCAGMNLENIYDTLYPVSDFILPSPFNQIPELRQIFFFKCLLLMFFHLIQEI